MKRMLLVAALAATVLPQLQGCAPLAVGAAAGGAVMMVGDRRTTGIYIEDENIEWKSLARIREVAPSAHVNATSYNRKVLLTGEATSDQEKKRIETEVRAVPSVLDVTNEIQVAGASSLASRGSDSLITSNVKVVTEAGTVYLMGLVSQAEGDAAADIARTTSGVTRVVKVFEYTR